MSEAIDTTELCEAFEIVDSVLKRFSFHGSLATLNLRCSARSLAWAIQLDATITVPDRDTGEPTEINFSHALTPWAVLRRKDPAEHIQQLLTHWFRELWRHEFEEGLQFDGVRSNDPHKDRTDNPHQAGKSHDRLA